MFVAYVVACTLDLKYCQALAYPEPLREEWQCERVQKEVTLNKGFLLVKQECIYIGETA